jgi:hypothetical protein
MRDHSRTIHNRYLKMLASCKILGLQGVEDDYVLAGFGAV